MTFSHYAIPAYRLPPEYAGPRKADLAPLNLAMLRQDPPEEHLIGPGDVLGVFVQGILPPSPDESPVVTNSNALNRQYYPPHGSVRLPTLGFPLSVEQSGALPLPLIDPLAVEGLTLQQAADKIRESYTQMGFVQPGRDRIFVTLIRPRVTRVLVIREDTGPNATLITKEQVPYGKRGNGSVIDLPAFENDVLHALAASGGLPGFDAFNEVWILRNSDNPHEVMTMVQEQLENGVEPQMVVEDMRMEVTAIKIPFRIHPHAPLPFSRDDILLKDGDVVFVAPRETEYFYTGGLLRGGRIPLPRDQDIDVLEAIALATGSIGGPAGASGQAVFRSGAGPGNIIPPTRVIVLRRLPNGQQISIRCNMTAALHATKERILIQPDDIVMLQYKPQELAGNVALNFFNFNVLIDPQEL